MTPFGQKEGSISFQKNGIGVYSTQTLSLTWHVAFTPGCSPHTSSNCAQNLQLERKCWFVGIHLPVATELTSQMCLLRAPAEPRDALRGRLPVVPPSHWRRVDALNLLHRAARRWSLRASSQPLKRAHLTAAQRGKRREQFRVSIHKSGERRPDVGWNTRGNHSSGYFKNVNSARAGVSDIFRFPSLIRTFPDAGVSPPSLTLGQLLCKCSRPKMSHL